MALRSIASAQQARRRKALSAASLAVWGVGVLILVRIGSMTAFAGSPSQVGAAASLKPGARTARQAGSAVDRINNPVKTVSDSLADFYKIYPQPPLLPIYRPMLVDMLANTHLTVFDSRFKYDAVFAMGLREKFTGLMSSYDKIMKNEQSEKIWAAMVGALGFDSEKVKADAEAIAAYAKNTPPADILKALDGTEKASEASVAEAFENIKSGLYSSCFSMGLFRIMELCGVEASKANVEEWAKALSISESKATSDLETWRQLQNKLKMAEEMIREVEIREKKKLAERLEQKAKALAEKAAAKAEEGKSE